MDDHKKAARFILINCDEYTSSEYVNGKLMKLPGAGNTNTQTRKSSGIELEGAKKFFGVNKGGGTF